MDRARAALLDTRLTGEAALPTGHQPGASHPAAQGGFYMGEVLPHMSTHHSAREAYIDTLAQLSQHSHSAAASRFAVAIMYGALPLVKLYLALGDNRIILVPVWPCVVVSWGRQLLSCCQVLCDG